MIFWQSYHNDVINITDFLNQNPLAAYGIGGLHVVSWVTCPRPNSQKYKIYLTSESRGGKLNLNQLRFSKRKDKIVIAYASPKINHINNSRVETNEDLMGSGTRHC